MVNLRTLHAIKVQALTVVVGEECLLCDPGSEYQKGGSWSKNAKIKREMGGENITI